MQTVDTIIHAGFIIPVQPLNQVLAKHSLVINQGKILDILPTQSCNNRYQSKNTQERLNHAIIPGLINAHTHSPMSLFRGLADDLSLDDWLNSHIWPAEKQWSNPEFIAAGTELAIAEMLRSGTTCFNEHYPFAKTIAETTDKLGMRACIGGFLIDFPTNDASDAKTYINKAEQLIQQFQSHPLITTAIAPHAPYSVSDDNFKACFKLADQYQLPLHIHIHETEFEVNNSLKEHGVRPLQRLNQLGLINQRFISVHSVCFDDSDIQLLAEHHAHIVHCPKSNLKLASGFAPIQKSINAGVNVALGTDSAASNNSLDLFSEMQTAAILAKAVSQNPTALPAAKALEMATLNGAKALGIDNITGSLEINKAADLAIVHLNDIESLPLYDPISQLVYATTKNQVTDTWVAGKQLLNNRKLLLINEERLRISAVAWQEKISKGL
ncbi:TRZ/ATZ family hydrolase [Piscirickettsia litoralis]|uniref:5-methylthioadenosine/S-adenosylhomocysteine deaminase n=1 Tax=Piscirickettsia litoralis TaxID=1891921 RepID=A0ABX3A498_9GAMM|nr:TRZ/ATZ family hydrolase [Piscirickettsia litoralis]ODN43663.1 N-ethylammeline chlorohydrolase [Piscirickettsia litoralis]